MKVIFKGIVQAKIKNISSFTHPHASANLCDFVLQYTKQVFLLVTK